MPLENSKKTFNHTNLNKWGEFTMSYYVYARSAKQSPEAIIAQVRKCIQYANEKGLLIEEVFTDDGFSGLSDDRLGYNKLLQTALNGDTIIAASAGSLTRDLCKLQALMQQISIASYFWIPWIFP